MGGINHIKKLSALLFLFFMFSISTTVFAENSSHIGKNYKTVESHKEITDQYELIKRAIQQKFKNDKSKSFNSKQLLEKRLFDDGTIEEDYVSNSVAVLDKNNKQIDASNVVAVTESGYIYSDGTQSDSGYIGSVGFAQTLYYTARYSDPLGYDMVYRVNKVQTVIGQQTSSSYCTALEHGYHIFNDLADYMNSAVITYPSLGQMYTVYSNHSDFYPREGGIGNQIYSFYIVTINNGSSISGTNPIGVS